MNKYEALIQLCDADIRRGQPQAAVKRLSRINVSRVPREWRMPLARISRRSGFHSLGLRLLGNIVNATSARDQSESATDAEIAEYAALLLRTGSVSEALDKLVSVDAQAVPEALLFRGYCHFIRWEFKEAVPILENYVRSPLEPYSLLVGKTNLAFALVEIRRHAVALDVLGEVIDESAKGGHFQLQSNCHAFCGQVHLQEGNFARAREEFESARQLIEISTTNDHFLVLKGNLILEALEKRTTKPLEQLRQLALRRQSWEALREADLFSLKVSFENEKFNHLYFGSPYAGFRDRLSLELGSAPDQLSYTLGKKSAPVFDVLRGTKDGVQVCNPGKKSHQLIEVLLRDFYRPLRVGGLFSALFPNEYFNYSSSPDRVHQLMRRSRHWLKSSGIPVSIDEADGYYSLSIKGNFAFQVPLERREVDSLGLQLEKLRSTFKGHDFLAKDARRKLRLSTSSVRNLIVAGIQNGEVERLGETKRDARYRIRDPLKKVA